MSLAIDEVVARLLTPLLSPKDIVSYLGCCRSLRTITHIELRLGTTTAERALQWRSRFGERFILATLDVMRCEQRMFIELAALPGLRQLTIRPPQSLISSGQPLGAARSLTSLRLFRCGGLDRLNLAPVAACRSLTELVVHCKLRMERRSGVSSACGQPVDGLAALHACPKLRLVDLKCCASAGVVAMLQGLSQSSSAARWSIESLVLAFCELMPDDLRPLALLPLLRNVDLSLNNLLTSVGALGECATLRSLILTGCSALNDVSGLATCQRLATLYLGACAALSDVTPLASCAALRVLHLNRCRLVTDVSALGTCASLELLNLRWSGATIVPRRASLRVVWDAETPLESGYQEGALL